MFWGLIMEPGKKYTQTVEKSFHISQASLDLESAQSSPVQVLLGFEGRNYLLCTLQKDKWIQAQLDLNFQVGDKVAFITPGPGLVHLTGYLVPEDDFDYGEGEESEAEEEEIPELQTNKKRKAETKTEKANKKMKSLTAKLLEEIDEDDSDDDDDSDVNLTDLIEEEAEEEEAEDEQEESDDVEGESDEDQDEESAEEEEEEIQQLKKNKNKPNQNGIAKSPMTAKSPKGEKSPKNKQKKRTLQGGVVIEELKVGEGALAVPGKQVSVYYEGRLQSNNKVFDSTKKGNGFRFRLGKQEVIKGWDVGVQGMKVGGKRRIICPPNMAYGASGSPPVIPPQSTLVFEVELKNVK